ncbi:MAG: class I SAM-dependent methyltransferase [Cyanobacteria bacterium P01_A01_bin.40]
MTLYDAIGKGYNSTRKPDSRIVKQLISLLNLPRGSTIADVGAGTGNYSKAIADWGYRVIAIEPSLVMQSQRQQHPQISWYTAAAEQIPLPAQAVDGVVVMLALHHFDDINLGIKEINRICPTGKIVIFAFEQSKIPDFWLTEYFPHFISDTIATFPSTQKLTQIISSLRHQKVAIIPFLLPPDLSDLFAASGWCQPEIYLDSQVRNGISTFAKMPQNELKKGLKRLASDLDNGIWIKKYGYLLQQDNYDAGYRILVTQ